MVELVAPRRVVAVFAVAVAIGVVFVACGDDDDEAGPTTTEVSTTTTAMPTTVSLAPEQQAIAAYESSFIVFFQALNPPDPLSLALSQAFGGKARTTVTDAVMQAQDQGVYVVGSAATNPTVESATATEVVLVDCVVETNTTYDAATNEVRDSGSYPSYRRTTVVNHEGVWTVDTFEQLEEPCTPS